MKSHYKVYGKRGRLIYFFTTTTRGLDYCLKHIEKKFFNLHSYIVKVNGKKVWEKKRDAEMDHKKVLYKPTGVIYKSAREAAAGTNKKYGTVRWHLADNTKWFQYAD